MIAAYSVNVREATVALISVPAPVSTLAKNSVRINASVAARTSISNAIDACCSDRISVPTPA